MRKIHRGQNFFKSELTYRIHKKTFFIKRYIEIHLTNQDLRKNIAPSGPRMGTTLLERIVNATLNTPILVFQYPGFGQRNGCRFGWFRSFDEIIRFEQKFNFSSGYISIHVTRTSWSLCWYKRCSKFHFYWYLCTFTCPMGSFKSHCH